MFNIKNKLIQLFIIINNFYSRLKTNSSEKKIINICKNYDFSTTPEYHLWHTLSVFKKINKNQVYGDFVECGVWKGIYLVFFQKLIENYNLKSCKIYGYDTFKGTPLPSEDDGYPLKQKYYNKKINESTSGWNNALLKDVKSNYSLNTKPNDNLFLIKGKVEDTLLDKSNLPEKISILKLDLNLYRGTKIGLEILFPRVQKDGIIIIDNYLNYKGIKKAADNFFSSNTNIVKHYSVPDRLIVLKKE